MSRKVVAGNWKLNGNSAFAGEFASEFLSAIENLPADVTVIVAPPSILVPVVTSEFESTSVLVAAQNVAAQEKGAFTGEVSADMLKDAGCGACIVGHSERRALFSETDDQVAQKTRRLLDAGVTPIVCVGETLEQREQGSTLDVVLGQVKAVADSLGKDSLGQIIVAYEPVWAIGTGQTATPEQAQEVHSAIRACLAGYDSKVAESIPLLYGGSVNAENASTLFAQIDIDGGLVGGASLKAQDFAQICRAVG